MTAPEDIDGDDLVRERKPAGSTDETLFIKRPEGEGVFQRERRTSHVTDHKTVTYHRFDQDGRPHTEGYDPDEFDRAADGAIKAEKRGKRDEHFWLDFALALLAVACIAALVTAVALV